MVDPSAGITLASSDNEGGGLVVVGLCNGGSSLAIFGPAFSSQSAAAVAPLPTGLVSDSSPTTMTGVSDLAGSNGSVLELRDDSNGGSAAVILAVDGGGKGAVSVVKGNIGAKEAWSCSSSSRVTDRGEVKSNGGCALAAGVSPSGKTFVASVSLQREQVSSTGNGDGGGRISEEISGSRNLIVRVTEVGGGNGDFAAKAKIVGVFEAQALPSLGQGRPGLVQEAFLEALEGAGCVPVGDVGVCFRALVVNEDDSAMMVGARGVQWVREEALSAVEQVGQFFAIDTRIVLVIL